MKIDNETLKKLVVPLPKDSEVKSPYSKEESLEIFNLASLSEISKDSSLE